MFKFQIERTVEIEGCPRSGLAAVDFRRANGLPDGTDNTVDISCDMVSEKTVRECAAVGATITHSGDVDERKTYSGGTGWYRRNTWNRPGYSGEGTYYLTVPPSLIVRLLNDDSSVSYGTAWSELIALHFAEQAKAVAAWEAADAAHDEKMAREKAEKVAKDEAVAAAKLLLADDLKQRDKLKQAVSELSEFLANIPMDALQGTLKRMTEGAHGVSIDERKKTIEDASDQWIFSNRDDEVSDDDDSDN